MRSYRINGKNAHLNAQLSAVTTMDEAILLIDFII